MLKVVGAFSCIIIDFSWGFGIGTDHLWGTVSGFGVLNSFNFGCLRSSWRVPLYCSGYFSHLPCKIAFGFS